MISLWRFIALLFFVIICLEAVTKSVSFSQSKVRSWNYSKKEFATPREQIFVSTCHLCFAQGNILNFLTTWTSLKSSFFFSDWLQIIILKSGLVSDTNYFPSCVLVVPYLWLINLMLEIRKSWVFCFLFFCFKCKIR